MNERQRRKSTEKTIDERMFPRFFVISVLSGRGGGLLGRAETVADWKVLLGFVLVAVKLALVLSAVAGRPMRIRHASHA